MAKKAAIVLCGCGARDGSEIHEATLTLLHVLKNGAEPVFFAPASPQARVVNHLTGNVEAGEERNMLIEAARIARGKVKDIKELKASEADCLFFPGGNGAAHNIFSFATDGINCKVNPEVERVINEFYGAKKPIGFICISPVLAARVLGKHGIEITIGTDPETAQAVTALGARHFDKKATEFHIDNTHRVGSTPAYMLAKNAAEVDEGVSGLVKAILEMV